MASTRPRRSLHGARSPPHDASPSTTNAETNELKLAPDQGILTVKNAYREFTTFLDLKSNFRNEFLTRLWHHVTQSEHTWETLFANEGERRKCATGFADKVGMEYWGSEENRRFYLLPDSLADKEVLFMYPERREEIIRVVTILLEKKAKSEMGTQPDPETEKSSKRGRENTPVKDSKRGKRKSSPKRQSANHDCPSPELGDTEMKNLTADAEQPVGERDNTKSIKASPDVRTTSSVPEKETIPVAASTRDDIASSENFSFLEEKYAKVTRFLVKASTQGDLAPVSVPFYRYSSVLSFFSFMAEECDLPKWDPAAQLSNEISDAFSPSPSSAPPSPVSYASVRFEWSGHSVRVRSGKEHDWNEVLRHIHKGWAVEERKRQMEGNGDDYYYGADDFNISVMLHVSG